MWSLDRGRFTDRTVENSRQLTDSSIYGNLIYSRTGLANQLGEKRALKQCLNNWNNGYLHLYTNINSGWVKNTNVKKTCDTFGRQWKSFLTQNSKSSGHRGIMDKSGYRKIKTFCSLAVKWEGEPQTGRCLQLVQLTKSRKPIWEKQAQEGTGISPRRTREWPETWQDGPLH